MVLIEILSFIGALSLARLFTFILTPAENVEPIFGIYKRPGKWYWAKYLAMFFILKSRKILGYLDRQRHHRTGYGLKSRSSPEEMEGVQTLSPEHPKAVEAVFFILCSKEGFYMMCGSEKRHNNIHNGYVYLLVPGVGLLGSEKLPNTVLHGGHPNSYGAEGIKISLVKPMKEWTVEFDGNMKYMSKKEDNENSESKFLKVKLEGTWQSDLPYFDFDTDLNTNQICKALAVEDWTEDFFRYLREAHQTHYEHMGNMKAKLSIDGKPYEFEGLSFRDHSYGFKRDWNLMHRYIYHILFMENGMTLSIGVLSQPCTTSCLKTGYVYEPDGTVHSLQKCDLELYQHGERGIPTRDYAFSFSAGNKNYWIQVEIVDEAAHVVGGNSEEARMVELFVKVRVNGKINGRGICEYNYNNAYYQKIIGTSL